MKACIRKTRYVGVCSSIGIDGGCGDSYVAASGQGQTVKDAWLRPARLVTSLYMKNSIYRLVKLGLNSYSVCQPHQFPNISHTECTTYASGQSTSAHVIYSFGGVTVDDCNGSAILQE